MYIVDGRPRLRVKRPGELKYKAVQPTTRDSYDKLMKVTECMGLEIGLDWHWEDFPTDIDFYKELQGNVCVWVNSQVIVPKPREYFEKELHHNIISPEEFYKMQEIPEEKFKAIDIWFEENKPNRASKGLENKVK